MSDLPPPERPIARAGRHLDRDVRSAVFFLALPVLCEQFLVFCVGFYDTFLSGQIDARATTAIGLAAYVGWLASMMFGLVNIGTTALVARNWGAGQFREANLVLNRSITLAAGFGLAVAIAVWLLAPALATILGMDGSTAAVVVRYLRIDAFGHPFTACLLAGAGALRGAGDMRTPMWVLGGISVTNVIASTLFVFGIGPIAPLGIDGIVLGTITAKGLGGLAMMCVLARGIDRLKLDRNEMSPFGPIVKRILRIGVPGVIDGGVMWAGQLMFLMVISRLSHGEFGSAIFAAHIVGIQIEAITYLPAVAWGRAAATLVGQSLGAGRPDRARQYGHEAVVQCSMLAVLITATFYFGADSIYHLMHEDPAVRVVGIPAFRLLALFQWPLVVAIIYVFALRGAGDTRTPMIITMIGVLGVRVPVAYLCGVVWNGGLLGAWIGMCVDISVRSILVSLWYHFGKWERTNV